MFLGTSIFYATIVASLAEMESMYGELRACKAQPIYS